MKRKTVTQLTRTRLIIGDIAFDVTSPLDGVVPKISAIQEDSYRISFVPSISKTQARQTAIQVTHLPSRASHCRLVVLPHNAPHEARVLNDQLKFIAFETHALQLDPADNLLLTCMWLSLENVQVRDPKRSPILQPVIDWGHHFKRTFPDRYTGLPYFPPDPDIDVTALGVMGIDASQIPQRGPLWFKLRGDTTGSKVPKLLGEFIPRNPSPDYSFFKREVFDGWRELTMRMGRLREAVQIACIMTAFGDYQFQEAGYCALDSNRGASPDGYIVDPSMDWDSVPPSTRESYRGRVKDPARGVIEFKASRNDCTIQPYHLQQCVWEMMCTNTVWCDIVRYQETWEHDNATNRFHTKYACKKLRIFRHEPTEKEMCRLVDLSNVALKKGSLTFVELVWTQPFVQFRDHFKSLANQCNEDATNVPVPPNLVADMDKYRNQVSMNQVSDMPSLHPALDRIEQRQSEAFNLFNGGNDERRQFAGLASDQIKDYSELIQFVLKE